MSYSQIQKCTVAIFLLKVDSVVAENNMHDIITVTPSRHFDLRKTCGFFVDGYYGSGFIAEAQPNPTDSFTCLITANHCIDPPNAKHKPKSALCVHPGGWFVLDIEMALCHKPFNIAVFRVPKDVALKLPKEFNLPIYSDVNIIPPVGATVSLFGYSKISYQHDPHYLTSTFRQNDGGPVYKQGIVAHSLVQTADEQKFSSSMRRAARACVARRCLMMLSMSIKKFNRLTIHRYMLKNLHANDCVVFLSDMKIEMLKEMLNRLQREFDN